MKTTIGVFFGGRSTEHEISVISASQAMHAINAEKYEVVPIYISKQGKWYTGKALLDIQNYRNIPELLAKVDEVYMEPSFGDYNLYKKKRNLFGSNVIKHLDVIIPVLCCMAQTAKMAYLKACSKPSAFHTPDATLCRVPTAWTKSQ